MLVQEPHLTSEHTQIHSGSLAAVELDSMHKPRAGAC